MSEPSAASVLKSGAKPRWRRWLKRIIRVVVALAVALGAGVCDMELPGGQGAERGDCPDSSGGRADDVCRVAGGSAGGGSGSGCGALLCGGDGALAPSYPMKSTIWRMPLPRGPATPAVLSTANKMLEPNGLALEMLDRGSAMPECASDLGLSHGMSVLLPRLNRRSRADAAQFRPHPIAGRRRARHRRQLIPRSQR